MMNAQVSPTKQMMQELDAELGVKMRPTLESALPPDIDVQRFIGVCKTAINNNPDLLNADRRSLFNACVLAAQDGLLPDSKEGVLTVYRTNVGTKQQPNWIAKVSWHPMIGGFRKIAAQHGFALMDHAVYQHDVFEYEMGDEERIVHKAPPLGEPRGEIIGAYAIATNNKTGEKYREVMDRAALQQIRDCAKSDSIWSAWPGEQARKSVSRRLFKKLPFYSEDSVQRVMSHDDENFYLSQAKPVGKPVVAMPRAKSAAALGAPPVEVSQPLPTVTDAESAEFVAEMDSATPELAHAD